jgi:hypothetical protein
MGSKAHVCVRLLILQAFEFIPLLVLFGSDQAKIFKYNSKLTFRETSQRTLKKDS